MLYSRSRLGSLTSELTLSSFRTVAFTLVTTAAIAGGTAAQAQTMVASTATPQSGLAKHCDDIKDVFGLAKFNGEYKAKADAFLADGCTGTLPIPAKGDAYNIRRLNTASFVLHANGIELN